MHPSSRLLPLVGAHNFRDIGGYPTVDGGMTLWGQLYRSDTLHALTAADLVVLREVGLASVVDLRTAREIERTGRGLLQAEPIQYLHLSVSQEGDSNGGALPTDADLDLATVDLAELYLRWLAPGRRAFVDALIAVADSSSYPLVFHCAAGKDRTGVLAALVLDILKVQRRAIVDDYVLTSTRMHLIRGRQALDPDMAEVIVGAPQLFTAEPSTMERFLDALYDQFGGGREWAMAAGVPAEALDTMSALLVEGG